VFLFVIECGGEYRGYRGLVRKIIGGGS